MIDMENITKVSILLCTSLDNNTSLEDPRIANVKSICYGTALPILCTFGIIGNVLNLIVLTRRNMRSTAYIYMRAYSAAALLAILFCISFGLRVLDQKETGGWTNWTKAFYHTYLELFLGNVCLGVGVMMLLAVTMERYINVCHPGQYTKPLFGPPLLIVTLVTLITFLLYLPDIFRSKIISCLLTPAGPLVYQKRDNVAFMHSMPYRIYKVVLEVIYKVVPTILLTCFNIPIVIAFRRSCERRRRTTLSRTSSSDEKHKTFGEERRMILLLSSTSILFLVCISPMVVLNITLSESNLNLYPYQVFRAVANLLEVANYSITFYIYCLFSEDFRNTLIRTFQWLWWSKGRNDRRDPTKRSPIRRPTTTTTLPTTAVPMPSRPSRASV